MKACYAAHIHRVMHKSVSTLEAGSWGYPAADKTSGSELYGPSGSLDSTKSNRVKNSKQNNTRLSEDTEEPLGFCGCHGISVVIFPVVGLRE